MNLNLIKTMALLLGMTLFLTACNNEEITPLLGCTDTDAVNFTRKATNDNGSCAYLNNKIIGEWKASLWELEGNDFVCSDFILAYDFQEGGQFEYTFTGQVLNSLSGYGTWETAGSQLKLDYGGNGLNWKLLKALRKVEISKEEQFTASFEIDFNHLNLETDFDNFSLAIELTKDKKEAINKGGF